MTRLPRQWSTFAVVLMLLLSGPVVAAPLDSGSTDAVAGAYDGKTTPVAEELFTSGLFGPVVSDEVIRGGANADPTVFAYYSNGSYDSLESWANQSDRRHILRNDTDSNRALVRAPPAAILGGYLTREREVAGFSVPWVYRPDGLATKTYIERWTPNRQVANVEPIGRLRTEEERETPVNDAVIDGAFEADGVAYRNDTNRSLPSDAKDVMAVDEVSATGDGVAIGICDTGVNLPVADGTIFGNGTSNSTLRIDAARDFVGPNRGTTIDDANKTYDLSNVSDDNGHGSWIAGYVAANHSNTSLDGIAPGATLHIGRSLDADGQGSVGDIAECIAWQDEQGSDVLILSLGSQKYSPVLAEELREFEQGNGTIALVAAGNSRYVPTHRYISSPADVPTEGVLGVGATNTRPPADAESAYFSEVGPDDGARDLSNGVTADEGPDIAAPGMRIVAPTANGNRSLSGTSMAGPGVGGVSALLLDAKPGLRNNTTAVRERLVDGAVPIQHAGTTEVGAGMVNASNAINDVDPEESQTDARTADAVARDEANRAYSGYYGRSLAKGSGIAGWLPFQLRAS